MEDWAEVAAQIVERRAESPIEAAFGCLLNPELARLVDADGVIREEQLPPAE